MTGNTQGTVGILKSEESKTENPDDYFVWQDYLDATNSKEVPQILFSHVEQSLLSGFQEGMKVEVPLKDDSNSYWVATIITACGPLLSLRYVGDKDDRSRDFWCDTSKCELHPLGWTEANGKILVPPNSLNISNEDLKLLLKGTQTISYDVTSSDCSTPIDRIKTGMKIEVQDNLNPYHLWIATVIDSVGGRLLLRYDNPNSSSDKDFWLFYLSTRLFPFGWCKSKGDPWKLIKPSCFNDSTYSDDEWDDVLKKSQEDGLKIVSPADLFQKNIGEIPAHNFSEGMKLETVHPQNRAEICPATISKIIDDKYFLVIVDDSNQKKSEESNETDDCDVKNINDELTFLATVSHPFIFPCGWAKSHNLKLTQLCGKISVKEDFDWDEYLTDCKSTPAKFKNHYTENMASDVGFEIGMKLEVVNPSQEHQICAATIANTNEHLLWVHLDSSDCFQPSIIFSMDSFDLFPVGWCEMNNYSIKPPQSYQPIQSSQSSDGSSVSTDISDVKVNDVKDKNKDSIKSAGESKGSFWCPKIYFNHKCFSGPFLSKGKLAQLPKSVGPGPVTLVMKEVLSMLISVAYISSRVLRELQLKTKPHPGMHIEVLKAKYKSNAYRANVEIVTGADKVADFCKEVCQKLQVCPFLFGPVAVGEKTCPENCSTLSKTRFCKGRNTQNGSQSNNALRKSVVSDSDSSSNTSKPNKLYTWSRRKRTLEKDYLSGFGKENEDTNPGGKRVRYETRGVKLPNFGLKKTNGHHNNNHNSNNSNVSNNVSNNDSGSKDSGTKNSNHGSSKDTSNITTIFNNNSSCSIGNNSSITMGKSVPQSQSLHHSPVYSDCSSVPSSQHDNPSSVQHTPVKKKRGRHSKAKKEELRKAAELASEVKMDDSLYQVDSNPVLWTVEDVYDYLRNTNDCDVLANLLKEEEFDGKSFMLLNLVSCLDSLKLNLKTALCLCRHVEAVKYTFFCKYVVPTDQIQESLD